MGGGDATMYIIAVKEAGGSAAYERNNKYKIVALCRSMECRYNESIVILSMNIIPVSIIHSSKNSGILTN